MGYVLSRPLDQTLVLDVLQVAASQGRDAAAGAFALPVATGVAAVQGKARESLGGMTLAQALAAKDSR
jgi:hypothetical protein